MLPSRPTAVCRMRFWRSVTLRKVFEYSPKWLWRCLVVDRAAATGNSCRLIACSVYAIQPCTSSQCHFIRSHVAGCKSVTVICHLHFWQNDRDLVRAAAVTRGWNGCRNKSQHWKLTLEKKKIDATPVGTRTWYLSIVSPALYHWAISTPLRDQILYRRKEKKKRKKRRKKLVKKRKKEKKDILKTRTKVFVVPPPPPPPPHPPLHPLVWMTCYGKTELNIFLTNIRLETERRPTWNLLANDVGGNGHHCGAVHPQHDTKLRGQVLRAHSGEKLRALRGGDRLHGLGVAGQRHCADRCQSARHRRSSAVSRGHLPPAEQVFCQHPGQSVHLVCLLFAVVWVVLIFRVTKSFKITCFG